MSPTKIYMIQRESDGKYYNAKDDFFATKMYLGTYALNADQIRLQLIHFKLEGTCRPIEVTDLEYSESLAAISTGVIIKMESIKKDLIDMKHYLPTVSKISKKTSNFLSGTIQHLSHINPDYKKFVDNNEDATDLFQAHWDEFTSFIANVQLYETMKLLHVMKAAMKNEKALIGISDKVLGYKLKDTV